MFVELSIERELGKATALHDTLGNQPAFYGAPERVHNPGLTLVSVMIASNEEPDRGEQTTFI